MMDGEKEAVRHRPGPASLAAMLFGEEKRRTSSSEFDFLAPSPVKGSPASPTRVWHDESHTGSVTTDLEERPSAPESVTVLGLGNERGKEKKDDRKEDNAGGREEGEEQREKPLSITSNVDDDNDQKGEEGEKGEEEGEVEGEEEEEEEEEVVMEQEEAVHGSYIRRYQKRSSFREVRHFPPPIPLLAQTGNLPCHMPWILKRTYKKDGRLVLREVKLKHHEFFRAHRSNGRLTLQVVHFEDSSRRARPDVHGPPYEEDQEEEKGTENDPPPSPSSPRSSSSTLSPPPLASSTSTSGQDERSSTIHEINALSTLSSFTPSGNTSAASSSPSFSLDSPSTSLSSSFSTEKNDNEVESSIRTTTTTTISIGENVNASMGIVSGCLANSLLQMPIPTIRPIHS